MNTKKDNKLTLFERREIRKAFHDGEWWFVITDVVAALTDSGGDNLSPLALEFKTAGGLQKIQCWNIEGIFRLIQSIPSPKAEPFKRWLARVGRERIEEIENPELAMGRMQEP